MILGRGHGIAGGKFDDANRLFDNIQRVCSGTGHRGKEPRGLGGGGGGGGMGVPKSHVGMGCGRMQTWTSVTHNTGDLKELIPEFYASSGDFLVNTQVCRCCVLMQASKSQGNRHSTAAPKLAVLHHTTAVSRVTHKLLARFTVCNRHHRRLSLAPRPCEEPPTGGRLAAGSAGARVHVDPGARHGAFRAVGEGLQGSQRRKVAAAAGPAVGHKAEWRSGRACRAAAVGCRQPPCPPLPSSLPLRSLP
jgi:hypothetical protein